MNKNLFSCNNYNNIHGDVFFVPSDDICFYIEKIPQDIGYFDVIKFKKSTAQMINGYLLETFHVFEYFICLYIKQKPFYKKISIILLKIIDVIKKFLKIKIFSEIWIIRDFDHYKCIGLYYGIPVFYKIFSSACDVNINLSIMIDSIKQYSNLDVVRFFACVYTDFDNVGCSVFEYSENLFKSFMIGYSDLDSYCRDFVLKETDSRKWFVCVLFVNIAINCVSFCLYIKSNQLFCQYQSVVSDINLLSVNIKQLPSKNHINYIFEEIYKK